MRRIAFLAALLVAWFSLSRSERKQLAAAGRGALARTSRQS